MPQPRKPKLFKPPEKPINLDILRRRYRKATQKESREIFTRERIEKLRAEIKQAELTMSSVGAKKYAILVTGQEVLAHLVTGKKYKTAIKINAALIRLNGVKQDLRMGEVRKTILTKVLSDGVVAFRGFKEKDKLEYIKSMQKTVSEMSSEQLKLSENSRHVLEEVIEVVENRYYFMFTNAIGVKNVALFESLENMLAKKLINQLHWRQTNKK